MNTLRSALIIGLIFFFIGCPARSYYGLFEKTDTVFIPALVGTWGEIGGGENTHVFLQGEENSYTVVFRNEKGDSGEYHAQLGKIGKFLFLDSYPMRDPSEYHTIATHMFWKVTLKGDSLYLTALDSDRLKELIDAKKLSVTHVRNGSDIILTAPTKDLRLLMFRLADDPKAFPEVGPLIRSKK